MVQKAYRTVICIVLISFLQPLSPVRSRYRGHSASKSYVSKRLSGGASVAILYDDKAEQDALVVTLQHINKKYALHLFREMPLVSHAQTITKLGGLTTLRQNDTFVYPHSAQTAKAQRVSYLGFITDNKGRAVADIYGLDATVPRSSVLGVTFPAPVTYIKIRTGLTVQPDLKGFFSRPEVQSHLARALSSKRAYLHFQNLYWNSVLFSVGEQYSFFFHKDPIIAIQQFVRWGREVQKHQSGLVR